MDENPPQNVVTDFRLTPRVAERRIREAAALTDNIDWSFHILERMGERDIPDSTVLRVLRDGILKGEVELTARGEWKCKMVHTVRGARDVGVVTVIMRSGRLFLKTVEWEDLT